MTTKVSLLSFWATDQSLYINVYLRSVYLRVHLIMHRNLNLDDIIPKIPSLDWDLSSSAQEEISVLKQPQVLVLPEDTGLNLECVSVMEPKIKPLINWDLKDNVKKERENTVMDQLVAFCEGQANEMERKRDTSSMITHNTEQLLLRGQITDFKWTSTQLQLKDSPTIYIDLRNDQFQTKRAPCISHSNVLIDPGCLEKQMRSSKRTSKTNASELTGKSVLLQEIRQSKLSFARLSGSKKNPQNSTKPQKISSGVKKEHLSNSETSYSEPACIQQASICRFSVEHKTQHNASSQTPTDVHAENKQSSGQAHREQHNDEVRHQKDLKFLEEFKPQSSANEKTDILYDPEASYLPSVNTLPPDLEIRECLLLTVSLSIPGVVTGKAQKKAQTVDSVSLNSHVYNALVAWFLSLTEPNTCNGKSMMIDAPFWVAGLQQLYINDGLALYICAVSREDGGPVRKRLRGRDVEKKQSLFHRRVFKFLSQTSLNTVAFWVPELNHVLEKQAYPEQVLLPSSYLDCFISVNPNREAVEKAFDMTPGFFWQTVEIEDQKCQRAEATSSQESHTETAVVLIYRALHLNPLAMHHTFMCSSGLDICGLRFLYPTRKLLTNFAVGMLNMHGGDHSHMPVLTLTLRGPHAKSQWREIAGPPDPKLARKTDPACINALYCHSRDQPLLYSPQLLSLVHLGLCLWFGGRMANNNLAGSDQIQDASNRENTRSHFLMSSPATLCITMKADIFLLASPVVGPHCYSYVLATCAKRGFSLLGLQKVQISSKQARHIGLTAKQVAVFCHAPTVFLDGEQVELSSQCLVMLMRRESAVRHSSGLPAGLMNELAAQGFIESIHARLMDDVMVAPHLCFHTVPYSKKIFNVLGGRMWTAPDFSHVVLSKHKYLSYPDTEQVVFLTLMGPNILEKEIDLLHKTGKEGFELLALKWLPSLSLQQAQELSPFEIGDREWQSSVPSLMSTPALVIALRRIRAFITLRRLLPPNYPGDLSILMSPTPETAFRQICLFFSETELIPDHSSRPSLKFLPPVHNLDRRSQSLYTYMTDGPEPLLTLALFKPGVWRRCFGQILSMIKHDGFTVVGLRVLQLNLDMANALMHPPEQDHTERKLELKYLTSGPSLALCLMKVNAVMGLLELTGPEDPAEARIIDQNLWRARYGSNRIHNGIYGSKSYKKAIKDIKLVFPEGVCSPESSVMRLEQIQCLRSDPRASFEREQTHALSSAVKDQFSQSLIASGFCQGKTTYLYPTVSSQSGANKTNINPQLLMFYQPRPTFELGRELLFICVSVPAGRLVCSALCQTTCLLMPFDLLRQNQPPLYSELLHRMLWADCHLVAGRFCTLDKKQRSHIAELLGSSAGGACHESLLSEGPCLIIALQGDNAVTCFNVILESICIERPDFESVRMKLLYPNSERGAEKLLCYLFDVLSCDSHHSIVQK
ncbi:dynein axonemal assembly factor 8 [Paramisgurnus dabryanus]|uniref:dynein axonemal assembly factor 8 n=1 Tax=Paramisgurnus dabryanus TaxID=90735 RepID=UPI003CCF2458